MHGAEEVVDVGEESFLSKVASAAEVVTVTVLRMVAQPIWHVPQGPCVVVVLVVGQHLSLGGTRSVVVSSRMQAGAAGQA